MHSSSDSDSNTPEPKSVSKRTTFSRQFEVAEELGTLRGLVEVLTDRVNSLSVDTKPNAINMASTAKNKLTFSGRPDEDIDELITRIEFMTLANNWNNEQLFGQILCTLRENALRWYSSKNVDDFKSDDKNDPAKLKAALKERFKSVLTQGDIMQKAFEEKQKPGESVDVYISKMLPRLAKLDNLSEDYKVSMLINGFLPVVSDQLKLRSDLTSIEAVEKWAKKVESLNFVKKSATVNVVEAGPSSSSTQNQAKQIACFNCGGNHFKRDCPNRFSRLNQMGSRGRGKQSNFRGKYVAHQQFRQPNPQQFYPRGVFNYRPRYQPGSGFVYSGYRSGTRGFRPSYRQQFRYPNYAGGVNYMTPDHMMMAGTPEFSYEGPHDSQESYGLVHDSSQGSVNCIEHDSYVDEEGSTWVKVAHPETANADNQMRPPAQN